MIRFRAILVGVGLVASVTLQTALGEDAAGPGPEFKEVYELILSHLAGANTSELDSAAIRGLVSALSPRVMFASNGPPSSESTGGGLVTKQLVFEGSIGFLRIAHVGRGLGGALRSAYDELSATNHLKGLVLDLRFADGGDYESLPETVGMFLEKDQALLDWGKGLMRAKPSAEPIQVPTAVLVNDKTAEAAEALAAMLRQSAASLILGSRTAGKATVFEEFALKDGARLRIATTPIRLADGVSFPAKGLEPDVPVEVGPEEERAYYADAFATLRRPGVVASAGAGTVTNPAGTNRTARRPQVNEALLVRERKNTQAAEIPAGPPREREADRPLVRDPVLARALDFLKGLALVRSGRS
jgi:hypothetical protein